ncbi:hypothetical protein [Phyllobacterium phragmitis]|uniref:hypothetical protein n=1 Tax=Phyllobacterium phragmitis TaxID=2670329 RepID=UPI0038B39BC9
MAGISRRERSCDAGAARFSLDEAVEDAEFESIAPQGDRARTIPLPIPVPFKPDQLSILKKGTGSDFAPAQARLPGASYWFLVLLAAFGAFWMSGGHVLVRYWQAPGTAAAGMKLSDVSTRVEAHGGSNVIFVTARVSNEGLQPDAVPELTVTLRERTGAERAYYLGTRGQFIAPGESISFSSRLPGLKDRVEAVNVRFSPR